MDDLKLSLSGLASYLSPSNQDWAPWPVRAVRGGLAALAAPGDVYSGRLPITDASGRTNPEAIGRMADLAGLMMLGTTGAPAHGVGEALLGSGPMLKSGAKEFYHVAPDSYQAGSPLMSLYRQYGDDAYDMFAKRWPESGDLSQYHANRIFLYDDLNEALGHPTPGKILRVDADALRRNGLLQYDDLEIPYGRKTGFPYVTSEVPAEYILGLAD